VRPRLNECRPLARQVCRSCWGTTSSTCHTLDTHRSRTLNLHSRGNRGRIRSDTAEQSRLAVADSMRGQDSRLAADNNRPVEAHKSAVVWLSPRPTQATNPNHHHANPSHHRHASHRHASRHHASRHHASRRHAAYRRHAIEPRQWRWRAPWPRRQQLVGRIEAGLGLSSFSLPAGVPMPHVPPQCGQLKSVWCAA
jgi:hypothetical protein